MQIPPVTRLTAADFLAPVEIDELTDIIGPCESPFTDRCSDKRFLPMPLAGNLELLDSTARQPTNGKRGTTPESVPPVQPRLGLDESIS